MTDAEAQIRLLKGEWLAARIVLALGAIVLIAGFFLPASYWAARTERSAGAQIAQPGLSRGQQFCNQAVAISRDYGIVPSGTRASGIPQRTDTRGRYVCQADAGNRGFAIAIDLMCTDLGDQRCFSLVSVSQSDGSVLYQRQDQ